MSDIDRSELSELTPSVLVGQSLESAPATNPEKPQPEANLQYAVPASSESSLQNEGGVEEGYGVYKPGGFHPVFIGDIYNGRYLVLNKLGYGLYSTVWLRLRKMLMALLHQDIKPDNIFVKFRDTSLIESQYLKQVPAAVQDRLADTYSPVLSQPLKRFYFTSGQSILDFEVALGDWGVASWADKHLTELIQPVTLRAPEVLIRAPWDATTDWWNLGAVILEVFRCVRMFDGRGPPDGHYDLRQHLSEIVAYFGPFPKALLEKGDIELVETYFDEAGYVRGAPPISLPSLESDAYMDDLDEENRKLFVLFLRALMKIDPQERMSTMDLLRQPWPGLSFG